MWNAFNNPKLSPSSSCKNVFKSKLCFLKCIRLVEVLTNYFFGKFKTEKINGRIKPFNAANLMWKTINNGRWPYPNLKPDAMLYKNQGKKRYKTCKTVKKETLQLFESNWVKCHKWLEWTPVKKGFNGELSF